MLHNNLIRIENQLTGTDDVFKRFELLDNYLKNDGVIISHFIFSLNDDYLDLIRFYIQHEACPAEHLIEAFQKYLFETGKLDLALLCLKQENFPRDRKIYQKLSDKSFSNTICEYVSDIQKMPSGSQFQSLHDLLILIFKEYQSMFTSNDLEMCSFVFMRAYGLLKIFEIYNEKLNSFKDILSLIVNHPEYQYLPSSEPEYFTDVRDWVWSPHSYPFYFAANEGCKEIFIPFYSHEDTPASVKINAVKLLKDKHHEDVLVDIADDLSKQFYKETAIILLMLKDDLLNNDINKYIIHLLMQVVRQEYADGLLKTNELPIIYQRKNNVSPTFFQKQPISLEWLITRSAVKIKDYVCYENGNTHASKKGMNRGVSFLHILNNKYLSIGCKMMALYALLHEKSRLFNSLKIQDTLLPAIELYLPVIEKEARTYAEKHAYDLDSLSDNLINFIHAEGESKIGKHFSYSSFKKIEENDLLDKIKNVKTDQNCVMM